MDTKIRIVSVRSYPDPRYPCREDAQRDPQLLRALPRRWRGRPALCLALAVTVSSGLCACSTGIGPLLAGGNGADLTMATSDNPRNAALLKVPVFEHGIGRGAYGCVSIAPPVFLSEEEAAQVIREEALKQGVDFSGAKTVEGTFPATNLYNDERMTDATRQGSLTLDGYDATLDIGFEFVSQQDVVDWQQTGNQSASVEFYEMKGTADRLAATVEGTAFFYDPGADFSEFNTDVNPTDENGQTLADHFAQFEAEQKEIMKEQLREQVRDFLQWLAAQGVI